MLELYEFELVGYPKDAPKDGIRFLEATDSPNNECGRIRVYNDGKYSDEFKSSCDVIKSEPADHPRNSSSYPDNLGIGELVYLSTNAKSDRQKTKSKDGSAIWDTKIEIIKIQKVICKMNLYILNQSIEFNIDDIKHEDALIYHIQVTDKEKIIIFGDLHGSFHTFWRHIKRLKRMGILDNEYKLKENYKIIFLGDILDRGQHAYEIFSYILRLMMQNNTAQKLNVIYNRGNHEENGTFDSKVSPNCPCFDQEITSKGMNYDQMKSYLDKFFSILPSAIVIEDSNNNRVWLSHGGFPIEIKETNNVKRPSITTFSDVIKNLNGNKILHYKSDTGIPLQIRWNDFYNDRDLNITYLDNTRGDGVYQISGSLAHFFCKGANLNFIIRGHQDYPFNSYLLSNSGNTDTTFNNRYVIGHISSNEIVKNDDIYINKNYFNSGVRKSVEGPIARIKLTNEMRIIKTGIKKYVFFPVITLSTNTDIGRPLTFDSFGILRFDLNNIESKFTKNEFNLIGGDNNKYKYEKYKYKYLQLKKGSQ
jgi:hypothetical protein